MMRKLFQSSAAWAITSAGIRAGGALLTLPLALRFIPEAEMGLYYTFLSLIALATLLDMGFGQTLSRFASYAWAGAKDFRDTGLPEHSGESKPNLPLLQELMTGARAYYTLAGIAMALILSLPGGWFISKEIAKSGLDPDLITCWIVMAVGISFSFSSEFWRTILFGIGGMREAHQVSVAAQFSGVLVTAGCLLAGLGIWAFPVSRFVIAALNRFLAQWFLRRRTSARPSGWMNNNQTVAAMWPMAWRQGVVAVGEFMALRGNILVCTVLFGLETTARYGLTLQIFGVLGAICTAPAAVIGPKISQLRLRNDSAGIARLFGMRLYLGLGALLLLGALAILAGPTLLSLIGSRTGLVATPIMVLLLGIQFLQCHQNFYGALVLTENLNPFVVPTLVSGILVAVCSFSFGSLWHLPGMMIGQGLVPILFLSWWTVWRGYRGLNLPLSRFIGCIVRRN